MKKIIKIIILLVLVGSCTSLQPKRNQIIYNDDSTIELKEAESDIVERDTTDLTREELLEIIKKYDTAQPIINVVSKDKGFFSLFVKDTFIITVKINDRTVKQEFQVKERVNYALIIWGVVALVVLIFLIFLIAKLKNIFWKAV